MGNKKINYLQLKLLFSVIFFTELLDLVISEQFPSIKIIKFASLLILLVTLPVLAVTIKLMKAKDEEFRQDKQKLKNIFDTLDVAIWSHDMKTDMLLITPGIEKLYGYPYTAFYKDFDLWRKVIYPEDQHLLEDRAIRLANGETVTSEYRIIRPGGEVRWIQDSGFPTLDQAGNFVDFNSVLFDITDRKESEDRYRSLVEMSPDIIAVVSQEKIEYINEAGSKLVGANHPCELIGKSPLQFVPKEIVDVYQVKRLQNHLQKIRLEFQVTKLSGETIDVEMASTPILFEGRFAIQVVGRDITERKLAEKTIQNMAYHDSLTGLPNRNRFTKYLNEVLNRQGHKVLAVLFLDLDRFKIINDTKGHTVGDIVLQLVADRLEMSVKQEGFVSRQGGDEFIILLEDVNKDEVALIAQRILYEFTKPFEVNHQEFFITPSIGISLYPTDGIDEETLIKHADMAMYQAKERGKNNFRFYSSSLNGNTVRKMELENGLRKAIEKNQLVLHYQPQVSLTTGELVGIEALVRWQHPEHGFIAPSEFIPLAEETGLIVPIGKWVLWEACKQRKAWEAEGLSEEVPIAVNVSVRQFEDDHLIEYISTVLDELNLQAHQLEMEITESVMQNLDNSKIILDHLKNRGILLSIDDFGTGYSSLSYLKHLPIDKIKIDKSFVDDIIYHANQGIMVKTIIDMGLNLNFVVIAEGIETEEQLLFLKRNHCKIGQGYLFSRPLPAKEMKAYFMKNKQESGIQH